ncbi:MAG: hypothetical protein DSZ31_05510 [Gammaproteobacteria bacterium]|nr:MAG: hypothetical protein DSZ31_05510 [Gammaproteobacteria bacterium]
MGILKGFFEDIPIFYRYFIWHLGQNLFVVLITSVLLGAILSTLLFFNIAKNTQPQVLLKYALSSVGAFLPIFFPLFEFTACALTVHLFFRTKLNLIVFTFGIPPRRLVLPIFLTSLGIGLILTAYFEFIYPYAGYVQKVSYLEAKNKPLKEGVVENFWYKLGKDEFIYFRLINLKEGLAFGGKYFKVDKDYQLEWIIQIPRAKFSVKKDKIVVTADKFAFFSEREKKISRELHLELNLETKLLKVKNPQFFSLRELIGLLFLAKDIGLNYYPYLWELVKRLLLVVFSVIVPLVSVIKLFSATRNEEFFSSVGFLSFIFVSFYVALLFFQNAVNKVSVNPLYGLLLIVPYLFLAFWTIKRN